MVGGPILPGPGAPLHGRWSDKPCLRHPVCRLNRALDLGVEPHIPEWVIPIFYAGIPRWSKVYSGGCAPEYALNVEEEP